KLLRAARLAVASGWEAGQALIGPGSGNAEPGMNQQKGRAPQGLERLERSNLLTPPGRQDRFGLQEKGNVRAKRGGHALQLCRAEWRVEDLVQPQQRGRRIAAPATQTCRHRYLLLQMQADTVLDF